VGGHQLEWPRTLHVCQHKVGDVLSVSIQWHGRGQPMRSCIVVDPLGTLAVHRPSFFPGCHGEYVLGEFSK
jgi:hypothetical protein